STGVEGDALRELYESGIVVCALFYDSSGNPAPRIEDPVSTEPNPRETISDPGVPRMKLGVAKRFAEATGGITIKTSQEGVPAKLSAMIGRLRERYTIGYSSSNTGKDGRFRKIK